MNSDDNPKGGEASRSTEESPSENCKDSHKQDNTNIGEATPPAAQSRDNFNSDKITASTSTGLSSTATGAISRNNSSTEMKRTAAKELIEKYFYQLQTGCGNPKCTNKYCASSGEVEQMTPNQTAARAIQLFSQDAKLCDHYSQPPKIPRTTAPTTPTDLPSSSNFVATSIPSGEVGTSTGNTTSSTTIGNNTLNSSLDTIRTFEAIPASYNWPSTSNQRYMPCSSFSHFPKSKRVYKSDPTSSKLFLDEKIIHDLLGKCEQQKCYDALTAALGGTFSNFNYLSKSFYRDPDGSIDRILEKAGNSDLTKLKKEELRTLEGETDKDEDSCLVKKKQPKDSHTTVDLVSLRRSLVELFEFYDPEIADAVSGAIEGLFLEICGDFRLGMTSHYHPEKLLHCFVIAFEITHSAHPDYLERALPTVCKAAALLPIHLRARLARIWAHHCKDDLRSLIQSLQQLITLEVIMDDGHVQENTYIVSTTKTLKIAFFANILAGELDKTKVCDSSDTSETLTTDVDDYFYTQIPRRNSNRFPEDKLEKELGISPLDCRVPVVPFEEFYNEPLSDEIQMDHDYLAYKNYLMDPIGEEVDFTFMFYSFILTPAKKIIALYYDSRIRMYSERNLSFYTLANHFGGDNELGMRPYLKLKVRRDHIIDDALVELEMIAMSSPKDFKKQLVVEFIGEQGIDEGGVSKEFFQLVVEEIFNPDFGMFTYQEDTKTVWFNSTPFENEAQFTLIGIILGLAIYNNIILAVNFPMVVYRKLMGRPGTFYDLADWNPALYNSFKSLLEYEGHDMEDVFMQTFKITYTNMFGEIVEHELKPNGDDILVNQDNKREFVELYCDFFLNKCISRQFRAFKKGFEMVTDESPLKLLFRPEEIELLVCGSRKFDFEELEKSTEYDGGYSSDSQIIKDFWSVVHSLPIESKRKLLEFTTGSDRVPVGGLSRLKLLITRNGSDSDRLPTSHTCYNVLLLPEYSDRAKLEDRLLKAINYSKGFGML